MTHKLLLLDASPLTVIIVFRLKREICFGNVLYDGREYLTLFPISLLRPFRTKPLKYFGANLPLVSRYRAS